MSGLPEAIESAESGWTPRNEIDVEHALRGLERLAARFAAIRSQGDVYRGEIQRWEIGETDRLRAAATPLVLGLEAWGREQRLISQGRVKSFRFPSGVIETTAARGKIEVTDEAALLAWCEANLVAAVKVEKSVLKTPLGKATVVDSENRLVSVEGEIIPGCRFVPGGETRFSVDVKLASNRELPAGPRAVIASD